MVEIANNVMEFDVNLLVDISGRIVSALEQQITAYQESDTNENVTVVFPNIGIQAVKVNVEHLESSLVYGHILPVGQITSINDELTQGNARLLVGPEETSGDRTTALISIPKSALEEAGTIRVHSKMIIFVTLLGSNHLMCKQLNSDTCMFAIFHHLIFRFTTVNPPD